MRKEESKDEDNDDDDEDSYNDPKGNDTRSFRRGVMARDSSNAEKYPNNAEKYLNNAEK